MEKSFSTYRQNKPLPTYGSDEEVLTDESDDEVLSSESNDEFNSESYLSSADEFSKTATIIEKSFVAKDLEQTLNAIATRKNKEGKVISESEDEEDGGLISSDNSDDSNRYQHSPIFKNRPKKTKTVRPIIESEDSDYEEPRHSKLSESNRNKIMSDSDDDSSNNSKSLPKKDQKSPTVTIQETDSDDSVNEIDSSIIEPESHLSKPNVIHVIEESEDSADQHESCVTDNQLGKPRAARVIEETDTDDEGSTLNLNTLCLSDPELLEKSRHTLPEDHSITAMNMNQQSKPKSLRKSNQNAKRSGHGTRSPIDLTSTTDEDAPSLHHSLKSSSDMIKPKRYSSEVVKTSGLDYKSSPKVMHDIKLISKPLRQERPGTEQGGLQPIKTEHPPRKDKSSDQQWDIKPKILTEKSKNNQEIKTEITPPLQPRLAPVNPALPKNMDYHRMAAEAEIRNLEGKIINLRNSVKQVQSALLTTAPHLLPDGGLMLTSRASKLKEELFQLERQRNVLKEQLLTPGPDLYTMGRPFEPVKPPPSVSWKELRNTADIQHGMGEKALENHRAERALTLDALRGLHKSLKSCPGEETLSEDPKLLRTDVKLMPHQQQALAWLAWREQQDPPGGILADDMGLGKTLTMISLVLKKKEDSDSEDSEEDNNSKKENKWYSSKKNRSVKGGTLVVCPASLLNQWEDEVNKRTKRGSLDVEVHHGPKREDRAYRLARKDIVITTYAIVRTEGKSKGALHQVKWKRIILDEAHVVRNHKSQTSIAVIELIGKYRWALTGTPIHNKELDLFALLKFLRCAPFDDLGVWRRWVDNKDANGLQRLNAVLKSIMLRRTKTQLQEKKVFKLPEKKFYQVDVKLTEGEHKVYEKILEFSRTLFAQFLHQRAEKEQLTNGTSGAYTPLDFKTMTQNPFEKNTNLGKMVTKYTSMTDIKSHQILVLLLRLRQICCHPGLIKAMLDQEAIAQDGIEDNDGLDIDIVDQISRMNLSEHGSKSNQLDKTGDGDAAPDEEILSSKNPVFEMERISSKIAAVLEILKEKVIDTNDKAVVVSQWASMLSVIWDHLKVMNVKIVMLSGAVLVKDRQKLVDDFNKENRGPKVMLLSLTAGGVGLNLVGGNHLLLCDLHWNPQLEAQACDRIYRVGQKKPVHIYKFVCEDTIEQRIKAMQEKKMVIASNILTGSRHASGNKLSIDDLKMLFDIK